MTDLNDREVETWYRGGAREEPPPALDTAILAAAHRAAGAGPMPLARRSRPVWMLPLAAAAVLVVSVTVLRLAPQEEVVPAMSASPDAPARESAVVPDSKPVVLPEKASQDMAGAAGALTAQDTASAPSKVRSAPGAPPPPVTKRDISPGASPQEIELAKGKRVAKRERYVPEPGPAMPPAAAVPQRVPAPAPAALESRAPLPALAASSPPLPPAEPRKFADPVIGEPAKLAARQEKFAPAEAAGAVHQSEPEAAAAAPVLRKGVAAGGRAAQAPVLAPEAWISKLLSLQAIGPETEFLKELAAFRRTYPQHPLPRSLEAALARLPDPTPRPFPGQTPR